MKCAIFDLDGTLVNSLNTISYYANLVLKENGIEEIPTERYKHIVGLGAKRLIRDSLAERGISDENIFHQAYNRNMEIYVSDAAYLSEVYAGIKELLSEMKNKNMKIAILSNKPEEQVKEVVSALFEEGTFDIVMGAVDEFPRKPDPTQALKLSEMLGVKPSECLYFGDTSTDMQTGKRAGFYTVGVTWGFREREELEANNADAIIENPKEAYNLF